MDAQQTGDNAATKAGSTAAPSVTANGKPKPQNLDYLYDLEVGVDAYFSTDLHRHPARAHQKGPAPVIAVGSTNSKQRVAEFAHVFLEKYPYEYRSYFLNCGHVIQDLFDDYDIQVLGSKFLNEVLQFIMCENVAVATQYADDFVKKHPDVLDTIGYFKYDKKDPNAAVRRIFNNGEIESCHVVFLWHVAHIIRMVANHIRERCPAVPETAVKNTAPAQPAGRITSGGKADPRAEVHPPESRRNASMPGAAPVIPHRKYIGAYMPPTGNMLTFVGTSEMEGPPHPHHKMHPSPDMIPMGPYGPSHLGPHDMPNAPVMRQHANQHPRNRSSSLRHSSGAGSTNGTWRGGMRGGENDPVGPMLPPPSRHSSGAMSAVPSPRFNAIQPAHPVPPMGHRMHPSGMYGQYPGNPVSPQLVNAVPCPPQMMYPQQNQPPHGRPFPEHIQHGHGPIMMGPPFPPMGDMTNNRQAFNPAIPPQDMFSHGNRRGMRPDRPPTLYNPYGKENPEFSNITRKSSRNSMSNGQGRGRKQSFTSQRNNFAQSNGPPIGYGSPDMGPLQVQPVFQHMENRGPPALDQESGCSDNYIGPSNEYVKELLIFDIPEGTTQEDLVIFFRENVGIHAHVHRIKSDKGGKQLAHIKYANLSTPFCYF